MGVLRVTFFLDISFCHDGFFKVNPLSLTLFANFEFWFRFCQHSYTQEKTGAWEEWPESNDPTSAWILGFDCNLKRLTSHHVRPWGTFGDALNPWAMSNFQTIPNSFFWNTWFHNKFKSKRHAVKYVSQLLGEGINQLAKIFGLGLRNRGDDLQEQPKMDVSWHPFKLWL